MEPVLLPCLDHERDEFVARDDAAQPRLQARIGEDIVAERRETALIRSGCHSHCLDRQIMVRGVGRLLLHWEDARIMSSAVDIGTLTAADFEPRLNETFRLQHGEGELPLKLHEVQRLAHAKRAGGGFSLLFVSAPGPIFSQSIHPLLHDEMGTVEMFLVPLGPGEGGNLYQAIFA
jgi:hypothetical protein